MGWADRLVDALPQTWLFQAIARHVLVPYWAWRLPVARRQGGPPPALAPVASLQHMMNLVMPLKDKSAIGRAKAVLAIAQNVDEIYAGLNNVGTVHFARFVIVGDDLCMFSVYDGDFSNYIRDFIVSVGSVFDAVVSLIEGGDAVIPCETHAEAFIDWVHAHDLYQVPDLATDLLIAHGGATDLRRLPRDLILQLNVNPNVSIGSGYRAYRGSRQRRSVSAWGLAGDGGFRPAGTTRQHPARLPPQDGPLPDAAGLQPRRRAGLPGIHRRTCRAGPGHHHRSAMGDQAGLRLQYRRDLRGSARARRPDRQPRELSLRIRRRHDRARAQARGLR
jgi:hypothetical protein